MKSLSERNNLIDNADCNFVEVLRLLKSKIIEDCSFNKEEKRKWFINNEFTSYSLGPIKLEFDTNLSRRKILNNKRNDECILIDYSQGGIQYLSDDNTLATVYALLEDIQNEIVSTRVIITDYLVSEELFKEIEKSEILNIDAGPCERVIWLHFPGTEFKDGTDELLVRTARKKDSETFKKYTVEDLQKEYYTQTNFFYGLYKIDFRFYQYKEDVIKALEVLTKSDVTLVKGLGENAEFYAGVVSGFLDGAIESVDLISLCVQAYVKFQQDYAIFSEPWWLDLYSKMDHKRNIFEAFQEKFNETYENWKTLTVDVDRIENFLKNDYLRNRMFSSFYNSIIAAIKKFVGDITFKNGSYDAGYVSGKIIFDYIPFATILSAGKGLTGIASFGEEMLEGVTKGFGDAIDGPIANKITKEIAEDISKLAKRLSTRPNINKWLLEDMTPEIKSYLAALPDGSQYDAFLDRLDKFVTKDFKAAINKKGLNGMKSYEYLDEAFPNKIPCLTP